MYPNGYVPPKADAAPRKRRSQSYSVAGEKPSAAASSRGDPAASHTTRKTASTTGAGSAASHRTTAPQSKAAAQGSYARHSVYDGQPRGEQATLYNGYGQQQYSPSSFGATPALSGQGAMGDPRGRRAQEASQERYAQTPQRRSPYAPQNGGSYGAAQHSQGEGAWRGAQGAEMAGMYGQNPPPYGQTWGQGAPAPSGQSLPPQLPPTVPPYEGQGEGMPPKPPKRRGFNPLLLLVVLVAVVGLGIGGNSWLKHSQATSAVTPYNDRYCNGVYVDGIHLGGMTQAEAMTAVQSQIQSKNDSWSVKLTYSGQLVTEITAAQLGMTVDVSDTMRVAWEQGHVGDIYARQKAQEDLLVNNFQAYTAMPSGDTSVIDGILQSIKDNVYKNAEDAELLSFDTTLTYPFTFKEEVYGRMLDTSALKEKLYQMVSTMESGELAIVPETISPSVTVAQLKESLTMRASVYTPIDKHSTENRNNNIRRAFEMVNGYVLQPGAKFSFNGVVGQRTVKNGFFEAIEYAYGELATGIGGGVCQASTTLYQAAVEAGLKIVDRSPHSDSVSYASYGEDATVYWSNGRKIDLVFQNDTDSPIYIVATVQTDPSNANRYIAKVTMYGANLGTGVRYELQSEVVQTLKAPTEPEYVKDKKQTYVTYTDEEYTVRKAKDGYVVDSYRVKYVNEQVAETTKLFTDTYEPKTTRIYVGTKTRE